MQIDVVLTPAEFPALAARDLAHTTCVVFDVLRATSSMLTALNNGAEAIVPVVEITEALAINAKQPSVLLAGERHGLRISKELTGSVDFDFGNSPRDFTADKVRGTRARRACAHAEMVLLGALVNLSTLADLLGTLRPKNLLLVCAGTFEEGAFEDQFAAGALIESLASPQPRSLSDSAHLVWRAGRQAGSDSAALIDSSLNARRLMANPALAPDVPLCLQRDTIQLNASMLTDSSVRPMRGFGAKLA